MKTQQASKLQGTSKMGSTTTEHKKKIQEKSLEEEIYEKPIQNIEQERLNRVFDKICGLSRKGDLQKNERDDTKEALLDQPRDGFDKRDLIRILTELKFPYTKPEVDQWIWEVDEDLDGYVSKYEFTLMYKRCIFDKNGLEPRNLFNLVQFLMYDQGEKGRITVEDTLQLIYVRYKDQLEENIKSIFGEEEKGPDDLEKQITFEEYLKQIRKRDLERRKKLEEERKTVKEVIKKKNKQ